MTPTLPQKRSTLAVAIIAIVIAGTSAFAQSQAFNGQIEGTVTDSDNAAVQNAAVTVTNLETGAARIVSTNERGYFRTPLLPIGRYSITVEANGFSTLFRDGITLATGQSVTLDLPLTTGDVRENVIVTSDAPIADAGKIDQGRVMNSREVHNLPLLQNPYNFVFLQSNVTGNRMAVPGLGFANVNANGYSRRGNYQIDGNYATDVSLGGVRMLFLARPYIQEIQLLTNGMNAEFGATIGHVMNVITPSGSNTFSGEVTYQFHRHGFAARPFNSPLGAPDIRPYSDTFTGMIGGPIIKDRWHFYFGIEAFKRDLVSSSRTINLSEGNRQMLTGAGVPASAMPASYDAPELFRFYIGRTDLQMNGSNRLGIRLFVTEGTAEKLGIGGMPGNTLQLTRDNINLQTSLAVQLISNKGERLFNELRFQHSDRDIRMVPNEHTGPGDINIRIDGIAGFGAPAAGRTAVVEYLLTTFQNNTTFFFGDHALKAGFGLAAYNSFNDSSPSAVYTFANVQAYLEAASGVNRRSYRQYSDTFGESYTELDAVYWNAFIQDEWRVGRRLKINAGLRYDLFTLPKADPAAPHPAARKFRLDKNNFGPRLGLAYQLTGGQRPAVLRASAGLYYDPPILNFYQRARLGSGDPAYFSFSFGPESDGQSQAGPEFPDRFPVFPKSHALPVPNIEAIDPGFKTMSALHANIQFEKAITEDLSFTAAYTRSSGRHIPTSRQVNCRPTGGALADGRPLYGTVSVAANGRAIVFPCTDRIAPQFNLVWMWESVGNLQYDAATFTLAKRYSSGYQMSLNYTLARSHDDAAEENIFATAQWQSDPSNRRTDRAISVTNQTHTFVGTIVARPTFNVSRPVLKFILNNNQFGLIVRASDGERYNIRTNIDLNGDGGLMDRPVGIPRNFLKTPPFFNVDLRYSRIFELSERHRVEIYADIVNLTNTKSIVAFSNTVVQATSLISSPVNPLTGVIQAPLPDFRNLAVTTNDSRRLQLGIRYSF